MQTLHKDTPSPRGSKWALTACAGVASFCAVGLPVHLAHPLCLWHWPFLPSHLFDDDKMVLRSIRACTRASARTCHCCVFRVCPAAPHHLNHRTPQSHQLPSTCAPPWSLRFPPWVFFVPHTVYEQLIMLFKSITLRTSFCPVSVLDELRYG